PGIVPEIGASPRRPPAIATLNHAREMLRKRLVAPLLVWCDPLTYTALQEHAPDFFDHYTALFTFLDAAPEPQIVESEVKRPEPDVVARVVQRQVAASRAAVEFYEDQVARLQEPTPERARALLGLAEALGQLSDAHVVSRLRRAENLTREALSLLSPEREKEEWARGQNTLGIILRNSPSGDRMENLRQAIACFEAALRVRTEAEFPYDWAATQNNLGNTYADLPSGDRAENLRQAIACYEAALRVYTEADFPQDWAMTQNNLGTAYDNLSSGDRVENLRQAIACYQAALRVRTEADFPQNWANTQFNLGLTYSDLAAETNDFTLLRVARECFAMAERGYKSVGLVEHAAETAHLQARVEAELAKRETKPSQRRQSRHKRDAVVKEA
ncbi:MAG: tetratricopeptide repeat protein, partial [Armatimonadota bacterium]|nr:tetratricopeptide repeat protein [Armatimonadota bacterium]